VLPAAAVLTGCGGATEPDTPFELVAAAAELPAIPVLGTDTTLDIGTWNLEWFGDGGNGPSPEGRQLDNVWTVLDATGVDLWAVQEVARAGHFEDLVAQLAGYDGLLATDPRVADGAAYYSDFGGGEQKVGLLYRTRAVTVDSARVILAGHDDDFAGRPPVEAHLTVGDSGGAALVVIVLHAKAGAAAADRDRRARGSDALKAYLDAAHPGSRVLVIGDFNDDVDTSIVAGHPSPYRNFVDDTAYAFLTAALSAAGETSTVFYADMIDHHLGSDELAADYVDGSARVAPADAWLPAYAESTSDHFPVLARYASPGGAVAFTTGGLRHVDLRWTGGETERVDVYRDGTRVVTTANDGRYIDSVDDAVGAVVVYRVCEADSDPCTEDAPVEL
jgi:endonuclease/exonuclease/phosphatase family metal-dependent hydrolase